MANDRPVRVSKRERRAERVLLTALRNAVNAGLDPQEVETA